MISWLRRFNVTTRIMTLTIFLVAILALSQIFLLSQLERIKDRSVSQKQQVLEQNKWIEQQAELVHYQSDTQMLMQQAQQIQRSYSEMLFWYFDGSVTQYYVSLNNASAAADKLEQQLAALALDKEAAPLVPVMLNNLSDYRDLMNSANHYYQQGRNNLAGSEISEAHYVVKHMNQQLEQITDIFHQRLKNAGARVESSLDKTLNASLQVARDSERSETTIDSVERTVVIILIVSSPIALAIAFVIILSITRPLKNLQQQLNQIETDSDLTHPLTITGRDEIRAMSEATQNLLNKLRHTLSNVGLMANDLKQTADQGYQVSLETHSQSTMQQQQTGSIASAATQLGAGADQIQQTTLDSLNIMDQVNAAAHTGQSDVRQTASTMTGMASHFSRVENNVRQLASQSESIGGVLNVIKDIAEQINLLALNAAIEAARAGDQGRGFAVVADEVRSLAQKTGQSANEIETMVSNLREQSRLAVSSLDENRVQVDQSVELSKQAEQSLHHIQQQMQNLTLTSQEIARVTQEQQQALLAVDSSAQQVRSLADNVQQHASVSESVNQQLDSMAERLQQVLLSFRH